MQKQHKVNVQHKSVENVCSDLLTEQPSPQVNEFTPQAIAAHALPQHNRLDINGQLRIRERVDNEKRDNEKVDNEKLDNEQGTNEQGITRPEISLLGRREKNLAFLLLTCILWQGIASTSSKHPCFVPLICLGIIVVICQSAMQWSSKAFLQTLLTTSILAFLSFLTVEAKFPSTKALQYFEQTFLQRSPRRGTFTNTLQGLIVGRPERRHPGEVKFLLRGTLPTGEIFLMQLRGPDVPWNRASRVKENDSVAITVKLRLAQTNSYSPLSYTSYLLRRGIVATGDILSLQYLPPPQQITPWRERLIQQLLLDYADQDALGVLLASTLGEESVLGEHLLDLFRQTGTSHLLVVSGFHVGAVYLLLVSVVRFLLGRFPKLFIYVPVDIPTAMIGFFGATVYTHIVGWDVTTTRSLFVIAIFALGQLLARRPQGFYTTLLALLVMLFLYPGCAFEVGCQLTFFALFGLCWAKAVLTLFSLEGKGLRQKMMQALLFNSGAFLFTTPIILFWFQTFSPLSILINWVCIPLFCWLCICGPTVTLLCYVCLVPGGRYLLGINLLGIRWFIDGLEWFNNWVSQSMLGFYQLEPSFAFWFAGVLMVCIIAASYVTTRALVTTAPARHKQRREDLMQ